MRPEDGEPWTIQHLITRYVDKIDELERQVKNLQLVLLRVNLSATFVESQRSELASIRASILDYERLLQDTVVRQEATQGDSRHH